MTRYTTFGIGAAVSGARVDALLSHAGVIAEAVCIDHTLGPTAGGSAKVARQTRADRTTVGFPAGGVRAAGTRLARVCHCRLRL